MRWSSEEAEKYSSQVGERRNMSHYIMLEYSLNCMIFISYIELKEMCSVSLACAFILLVVS